jgi:hypothetical protein
VIKKRLLTFRGELMDLMDWEKAEVFRLLKNAPGTQYQEADALGQLEIRSWVKNLLANSEVTVQFVKSDGTIRDMRCTLDSNRIPHAAAPKPISVPAEIQASSAANIDGLTVTESRKPRREPDPVTQRVYDLDQGAWRSFRYDRLKKITTEINFTK